MELWFSWRTTIFSIGPIFPPKKIRPRRTFYKNFGPGDQFLWDHFPVTNQLEESDSKSEQQWPEPTKSRFLYFESCKLAQFESLQFLFGDPLTEIYLLFYQSVLPVFNHFICFYNGRIPAFIWSTSYHCHSLLRKFVCKFVKADVIKALKSLS